MGERKSWTDLGTLRAVAIYLGRYLPMGEPEDVMSPPIYTDQRDTDEPDPHHESTDDEPAQDPGTVVVRNSRNLTVLTINSSAQVLHGI